MKNIKTKKNNLKKREKNNIIFFNENYKIWLENSNLNLKENKFLLNLSELEKKKLFSKIITSGPAGMRKIIGYGSDQFNIKTIKQLILGFIEIFQKKYNFKEYKFIIFHDSRKFSFEASEMIASILTSKGFDVIFNFENQVAPIPYLSYLLTNKFKAFGFMVTASHQSKYFNGCKIYSPYGYIISPLNTLEINNVLKTKHWEFLLKKINRKEKLISYLTLEEKNKYLVEIINQLSLPKSSKSRPKILYSSLHGSGFKWVNEVLIKAGYDIDLVEEQCTYDEDFPTLIDPNPESDSSFDLAIKKALKSKYIYDLIIINDSDVDRMRVAVWDGKKYNLLIGNEIASIFIYFFLKELRWKGGIYMTFVSTNLIYKIAQDFKCKVEKTMTGFYNLATKYSQDEPETFLFAFEESLGFLPSRQLSNDKDGLQSALLISEIVSFLRHKKNISVLDYLNLIGEKYGYFQYRQLKIKIKNDIKITKLMEEIKSLKELNGIPIKKITTYFYEGRDNLYQIFFDDGSWIGCRPSVTEAIFKFYFVSDSDKPEKSKSIVEKLKKNWEILFNKYV